LCRSASAWLTVACLLAVTGCGSSATGSLSGRVTYQGKTVASGSVLAIGADGIPNHGKIALDGSYSITGLPSGPVKLAVNSPPPLTDAQKAAVAGGRVDRARRAGNESAANAPIEQTADPKLWFAIPAKYGDPNTSGKEATLKSGSNTLNIELE
jgi:hypothetical protein